MEIDTGLLNHKTKAMRSIQTIFVKTVSYFFVLLFIYASVSKLLDFENFQVQLAQSPLISAYAEPISYAVIISELIIVAFLLVPTLRAIGLYLSFGIMVSFTLYIYLILNYSDFVPCSCGGILEKMSWNQHLIFNIVCVFLSAAAIFLQQSRINLKPTIAKISGITVLSSGIVIFLFLTSEHIIKKENNFIRRFPQHTIKEDRSYDLKVNSYYIAGAYQDTIYLGNSTSPFLLTKIGQDLKATRTTYLSPDKNLRYRAPKIAVADQSFYLYDGTIPIIFKGELNDTKGKAKTISYQYAFFDQIKSINNYQMVIRTQNNDNNRKVQNNQNVLGILSFQPFEYLIFSKDALQTKKDGVFDTDGQLLFDRNNEMIYYFYYYQSKILQFDKSLQLLSEQKTIDHSVSEVPEVKTLSNGTKKIAVPALPANQNMTVYHGIIFTQSNLMSKLETSSLWKKNNVIDVYNMNKNEYWGSIYLPNPGREKVHQLLVYKNYLYVLIGRKIVKYRIAQTLLDQFEQGKPKT